MKILISGFELEINENDSNLTLIVKDASGKELLNDTYEQEVQSQVEPAQVPSAEDVAAQAQPAQAQAQAQAQPQAQPQAQTQEKMTLIPSLESLKRKIIKK